MIGSVSRPGRRLVSALLAGLLAVGTVPARPALRDPPPAAQALQARYLALADRLRAGPFDVALQLHSVESADTVRGDLHAVLEHPFPRLAELAERPANWCDVLILHINVKFCRAVPGAEGTALRVGLGRKTAQAPEEAEVLLFDYRVVAAGPDFLEIRLDAGDGPMGTRDHRIVLQAMPLDAGRAFMRLSYAFSYGLAGRLAMKGYLATVGRDKVGFTPAGRDADGRARYVGGTRGLVERNAMRYFLAVDAYLDAAAQPPSRRPQARLEAWYDATERYPRQLHEMSRGEYLAMKREEYARQQNPR